MRVLAIYPGMDKRFNDNAYALTRLRDMGCELALITSRRTALKTEQVSAAYEEMNGVQIQRIYEDFAEQTAWPLKKYDNVRAVAAGFQPDLIFCSQQLNMRLARRLQRDFRVPIVLLVEFAWQPELLLGRRRSYLGIPALAPLLARFYWRWLCASSAAVITCNPADRRHLGALARHGTPVRFIGWCNQEPAERPAIAPSRERGRGVYIGSLQRRSFKNSEELCTTLPAILRETPTTEFVVVGNGALAAEIEKLERDFRGRLRYIRELERGEAWRLIASSFYAYTPVKHGGWGFIGDAWAAQTPVVATHNGYEFTAGADAQVTNPGQVSRAIEELYERPALYTGLQAGGRSRYEQFHTAERVANGYYEVFRSCL